MTEVYHIENSPIDLLCKSIDWFLFDRDFHYERDKLITRMVANGYFQILWIEFLYIWNSFC